MGLLGWLWVLAFTGSVIKTAAQTTQTLTWASPAKGEALVWGRAYPLTATASSGLPVSFRVQSGPAFITNGTVTATNAGFITLVAEQPGNAAFAATTLTRTFNSTTDSGPTYSGERLGQWPGHRRGEASGIFFQGTRAYTALGVAGIAIIDVSNPAVPVRLGGFDTSGSAVAVQVVGNLAYVADGDSGLQVIDVSNPAVPVSLGGFDTSGWASGVQVVGGLAYVADGYVWDGDSGLQVFDVIDVSNPAAPVRIGGFDTSGRASGVQVVGGLAYVADGPAGLQVIDVSNPAAPVRIGGFDTSGWASGVQVVGGLAYVADGYSGLQVIDVSNPAAPVRTGGFDTSGWASDVQVVGNLAYVANEYLVIQVIDVSNPAVPVRLGGFNTIGSAEAVQVVGNLAYVADGPAGLQVIDVSDPAAPVRIGGFVTRGWASGVQVVGGLAYVADGDSGLQVIDVSNPAASVRIGGFDTSGEAHGVLVVGGLAYVADGDSGLQVIDVSNPAAPVRIGGFETWAASGVQVVGGLAYVADMAGLQLIDVSNPAAPVHIGGFESGPGWSSGVQVVGQRAYVAKGRDGFQVIDVSNPVNPVSLGHLKTSGNVESIQVINNLAYVAEGELGLQLIDVSNPAAPVRIGGFDTSGEAYGVQVVGNLAYVAGGEWGLQIIRLKELEPSSQNLVFNPPASANLTQSPIILNADVSSGLPIVFSVVSGPATVEGNRLNITGEGTIVVRAEQKGNAQFAATRLERSIQVVSPPSEVQLKQTIEWTSPIPEELLVQRSLTPLNASASSGLPVTFRVIEGPGKISAVSNVWYSPKVFHVIEATNSGPITVIAEQSGGMIGGKNYLPTSVLRTFNKTLAPEQVRSLDWLRLDYLRGSGKFPEINQLSVDNDRAYLGTGIGLWVWEVVDITAKSTNSIIAPYQVYRESINDVTVSGNIVFVAIGKLGIAAVDVSNPLQPKSLGEYGVGGDAVCIQVERNLAYVGLRDNGIRIIDVSKPYAPSLKGGITNGVRSEKLQIDGKLAYVAVGLTNASGELGGGLQIYDVSIPSAPVQLGFISTKGPVTALKVIDNKAYLVDLVDGLQVIDVSNPLSPTAVGSWKMSGCQDVAIVGGIAYLACGDAGLFMVDISNLDEIKLQTRMQLMEDLVFQEWTLFQVNAVKIVGNRIYINNTRQTAVIQLSESEPQRLNIALPSSVELGVSTLKPNVVSSSGLPVKVTVKSGPAVMDGDLLVLTDLGSVVLQFSQVGDLKYAPISEERTLLINSSKKKQTIFWKSPNEATTLFPVSPYPIGALSSSGLPVTIRVMSGPAYLADGSMFVSGAGVISVIAEQSGDNQFERANSIKVFTGSYLIGQTTFTNLNFESAQVVETTPNFGWLSWNLAAPGWGPGGGIVYYRQTHLGDAGYFMLYDSQSPISAPGTQLAGRFSLGFANGFAGGQYASKSTFYQSYITQTGSIQSNVLSIRLLAKGSFAVFVGGVLIPMKYLGNYHYAGDISAFAGTTTDFRVVNTSDQIHDPVVLDNVELSSVAVLEPPVLVQYTITNRQVSITGYTDIEGRLVIPPLINGLPVTSIGEGAFSGCTQLTSVTIPESVTSIGKIAFSGCSGLNIITIPKSVISIGDNAFSGCSGLRSINVDAGNLKYSSVDGVLFGNNQSVIIKYPSRKPEYSFGSEYTIPNNVIIIGDEAFSGCSGLRRIVIPTSVSSIGEGAFSRCGLNSITIPESVISIGYEAFRGCPYIESITIPQSVTSIAGGLFRDCFYIKSITIPNSVVIIGAGAFDGCNRLTEVSIPYNVTSIGQYVFSNCSSLTRVTIPNSVTSIGYGAFLYCTGLTRVTIPNSVTTIDDSAFAGCSGLTSVSIPNSVTNIGSYAFSNCSGLVGLYFGGNMPDIGFNIFSGADKPTIYYHPEALGWGAALDGRPTKPLAQSIVTELGVKDGQFGFNVTGNIGLSFVVEAAADLAHPVWKPLATNTWDDATAFFSDPQWRAFPTRVYRLRGP